MSANQWRIHRTRWDDCEPEEMLIISVVAQACRDALQTKNSNLQQEAQEFLSVCAPDVYEQLCKDGSMRRLTLEDAKMATEFHTLAGVAADESGTRIAPPEHIPPRRKLTKRVDATTGAPDVSSSWPS